MIGLPSAGVHANGFTLVRRVLEDGGLRRDRPAGADAALPRRRAALRATRPRLRARDRRRIPGNLARVVPDGLAAELDWDAWPRPPVFAWLARHVDEEELRRVFNLGIGYCAVVAEPEDGELVIGRIVARMIGVLVSGEGTNLQALIDAGLPIVASRRTRPACGRSSGRERAEIPTAVFDAGRLRRPRGARRRAGRLAPRRTASSSSSAPATCTSSAGRSSTATAAGSSTRTRRRCRMFPGAHPVEDVLAAGVTETAATVHSSTRASTPAP